ncbi:hypothetical protein [Ruegeria marina]|uniref:Uncharacterized protein n=1 Tax=Ruegeria marina TaxID=639004 RepID=A0A1G7FCD2_9RHOB|nr:hypothetical protein [Ruegeria marina]SDE73484.1 hypothetical protein SAMN04488239_1329 [Ruegeria marina]
MPRKTMNWKVQQFGPEGALSKEQQSKLGLDHDIDVGELAHLSQTLAFALSPRTVTTRISTVIRQMNKGPEELELALQDLRRAERYLLKGSIRLSRLRIAYPALEKQVSDPNLLYRGKLYDALATVELLNTLLARSAGKFGVSALDEPDKRRVRDERRSVVLRQIFDFWDQIGRPVTISSDGSSSERSGPLVKFVNSVVRYSTDPQGTLNGETIWSEIKDWRIMQNLHEMATVAISK